MIISRAADQVARLVDRIPANGEALRRIHAMVEQGRHNPGRQRPAGGIRRAAARGLVRQARPGSQIIPALFSKARA